MSGREICPPSLVTVCSVVRPANRHAFWYRKSWQSPGARLGPARCSCPNIGVGAQVNPGHGLASSRARGKSDCASGQSGKYPKRALGLPLLRVVLWKTRSAPRVIRKIPEASQKRPCSESSARKVPACFESVHHLPEVFKWPSWLRVELEKTRYLLRVMLLVSHYLPGDMVAPSQT